MSLTARVTRLERGRETEAAGALPGWFWAALDGTLPSGELTPAARELLGRLLAGPDVSGAEEIEARVNGKDCFTSFGGRIHD